MEDQELIRRLLDPATQNQAFGQLMQLYGRPLYHHIRGMVIDHDDADDVLQNTFVKVFRHVKDFKGESKLFSWMYRIATNEALSFIKQRAKRHRISSEEMHDRMINNLKADVYYDGGEIEIKLQKAIALLPEKQKLVFNMRYFQEIKYEEMSEILGTSAGALKASYHHAVKKIEEYMKKH